MKALWLLLIISYAYPAHDSFHTRKLMSTRLIAQVSTEKPISNAKLIFKGQLEGGELKLWIKGRAFEVRTVKNERLEQIASEFAAAINSDPDMKEQDINAKAYGAELAIHVNEVWAFLCAGDKGLLVPAAPIDMRVTSNNDGTFHLSWKVPPGGYDRLHILRGLVPIADGIGGDNTDFADYVLGERPKYTVFGIKDNMPSCAAISN